MSTSVFLLGFGSIFGGACLAALVYNADKPKLRKFLVAGVMLAFIISLVAVGGMAGIPAKF